MFDIIIICRLCKKEEIVGYHPIWTKKNICYDCRERMIDKHKNWTTKIYLKHREKYKSLYDLPQPPREDGL